MHRRLVEEREERLENECPWLDVFTRTAAYIAGIRKLGCNAPAYEPSFHNSVDAESRLQHQKLKSVFQRGYKPPFDTCDGKLLLQMDVQDNHFIR